MADLRSMISSANSLDAPVEPKAEAKEIETPEPSAKVETPEPASDPGEKKKEPKESDDEDLPEGVKKRIAKESERAARAQAAIDRAVSERKAKESEAAKLKDAPGSQPDTKAQASDKPKRPAFGEDGHKDETWDQFEARQAKHDDVLADWVEKSAIAKFEAKQAEKTAKEAASKRWNEAVAKHGEDFPSLMEAAQEIAPEGLQLAISGLEHWSDVAVHLAKDTKQLKELAEKFATNPYAAIATLGRIEAALISKQAPKAAEKPLPEPVAKIGGNASAGGQDFQSMVEGGSMAQLKAHLKKLR